MKAHAEQNARGKHQIRQREGHKMADWDGLSEAMRVELIFREQVVLDATQKVEDTTETVKDTTPIVKDTTPTVRDTTQPQQQSYEAPGSAQSQDQ